MADVLSLRPAWRRALRDDWAYRAWSQGLVAPYRITWALDICLLDGPGVDEACGVAEPAVDEWEAGIRYPAWEELCALADLTGFSVRFFIRTPGIPPLLISGLSLQYHRPYGGRLPGWSPPPPVPCFLPEAIAAATKGHRLRKE